MHLPVSCTVAVMSMCGMVAWFFMLVDCTTATVGYERISIGTPVQARFGSAVGGIVLMTIPLVTMFSSIVLSLMTNARLAANSEP